MNISMIEAQKARVPFQDGTMGLTPRPHCRTLHDYCMFNHGLHSLLRAASEFRVGLTLDQIEL